MSAVSLLCSLRERPNDENQEDGSSQEGHEENGVSGGTGGGGDPAVLAVGPARRVLTYTREELLRLRNSPLVKRNLENAFAGCEALALVLKRRSDSPNEEDRGAKGDVPNENHKGVFGRERERERRSADPRERVRKESEPSGGGIVLSPQRRSFTSGCGAPSAAPHAPPHVARTRPESPLPIAAAQQPLANKTEQGGRRIGSGRILVRDVSGTWDECDYRNEHRPEHRAEPYRPPRERDHRANGDRFERRSFSRDTFSSDMKRERDDRFNNDKTRDREDNRRGRYSNRRYDKDEEPEWFSGGPTSQLETIELRGFDDPPKKNGTTNNNKDNDKWNNSGTRSPLERWRETSSPVQQPAETADTSNDKDSGVDSKTEEPQSNNDQPEFNLDEFLKFDTIPDVLTNGSGETEGGSRFSRWFRRESPTNDARHYERLLHNMVDELDSSPRAESAAGVGAGAGEAAHVFAPIAPAAAPPPRAHPPAHPPSHPPAHPPSHPPAHPPSLLDLLLRANEPRPDSGSAVGGKMHSLEELEARLRPQPQHHHHDSDLTAFKRLLAQVSGGHAVAAAAAGEPAARASHHAHHTAHHAHTTHHQQPMSLLQMLNKSVEQQQKAQQQQQQQQQQQPHIPQELLYKLLQVQQRQQQAGDMPGHVSGVMPPPPDRDLLQRPEAQAIVLGLKAGEITVQHLMQQLGNPGLQSRHREVLLTILRLHQQQRQMGGSPLPSGVGVGGSGHLVVPPHHQPLRLSPLPHQGVPARIPSPRELAAHTQSIMQNALIKKKLEEQRENYRRRHELQHAPPHAPHAQHAQHHQPKQPTPISFTPTSVLRKMTAEKESDAPSPKQQWAQPTKLPQGRAIVKGNQSGAAPPMGYSGPTPADYQQHYLNQQQQMVGGVRSYSHPQQRQQVSNSFNNMNNMARGMSGGSALHQLLVQSHQRSLNEMSGASVSMGGMGAAGGDNQLARWFSPELLARAHAGKLPSVHVPNALSLEDLERHHHSPAPHAPPLRN